MPACLVFSSSWIGAECGTVRAKCPSVRPSVVSSTVRLESTCGLHGESSGLPTDAAAYLARPAAASMSAANMMHSAQGAVSSGGNKMLKLIWGKTNQPTAERVKIQKELFQFQKVRAQQRSSLSLSRFRSGDFPLLIILHIRIRHGSGLRESRANCAKSPTPANPHNNTIGVTRLLATNSDPRIGIVLPFPVPSLPSPHSEIVVRTKRVARFSTQLLTRKGFYSTDSVPGRENDRVHDCCIG